MRPYTSGVTERISKGACAWHGASRIDTVLNKLLAGGNGTSAACIAAAAAASGMPSQSNNGSGGRASHYSPTYHLHLSRFVTTLLSPKPP